MRARRRVVTSLDRSGGRGPAWPAAPKPRPKPPSGGSPAGAGAPGSAPKGSAPRSPGGPAVVPLAPPLPVTAAPLDLSVELGSGLFLRNPIVVASGVMGYGIEVQDELAPERLGAFVTRGTTLKPRAGNAPPRLAEVPAGLLNAVGLQNPGLEAVLERYAEAWARWPLPVIVNLAAGSAAEFVDLARRLEGVPGVAGVELNLSCPNAARGGTLFAMEADSAGSVTTAVRRATDLPLIVKLSPAAADNRAVARAVADAGADAVAAVNTLPGLALAADRRGAATGVAYGGVSGPALRPIALRVVHEVAASVRVPVIAMGGVATLDDVLDFFAVGAQAVAVGTAALADPGLPARLADELEASCVARGLTSHLSLIGTALPRRPGVPSARGAEYRP